MTDEQFDSFETQFKAAGAQIAILGQQFDQAKTDLRQCDADIDDLQRRLAMKERPFYKDGVLITAVCALVLSFVTAITGEYRNSRQYVRDSDNELREIIRRLAALPRETLEVRIALTGKADDVVDLLQGDLLAENNVLAARALALIDALEGHVTPSEYMAVARPLIAAYELVDAERIIREAIACSNSAADRAQANRMLGTVYFLRQDPFRAREALKAAIIPTDQAAPYFANQRNCKTYIEWAGAELAFGAPHEAAERAGDASSLAQALPPSIAKEWLIKQIQLVNGQLENHKNTAAVVQAAATYQAQPAQGTPGAPGAQ